MLRRWDAANRTVDRALKLTPDSFQLWSIKAQTEICEKGTFEIMERGTEILASRPVSDDVRMHFNIALAQTRLLQRQYGEALRLIETIKDEAFANDLEGLMG